MSNYRLRTQGIGVKSYFEFMANFAQMNIAKGRLNQKIHKAFSRFHQIPPSGLSGNKLILTIFFLSLRFFSSEGLAPPLEIHFNG
jgi:hypothetical protein